MRHELRETVKQFLDQYEKPGDGNIPISEDLNQKLFSLACFVAEARSGVSRDRYTQAIEYLPEAEGPARLVKQLWTLGAGISIIQGKHELDEDVYSILKKVGKDTLPSHRNLILKKMWEKEIAGDSWENTRILSGFFNYPTMTTKLQLEDLMILNLLDRKFEGSSSDDDSYGYRKSETTPYYWSLSNHCRELIQTSEIYDAGNDEWEFGLDEARDLNKQSPGVALGP